MGEAAEKKFVSVAKENPNKNQPHSVKAENYSQ